MTATIEILIEMVTDLRQDLEELKEKVEYNSEFINNLILEQEGGYGG